MGLPELLDDSERNRRAASVPIYRLTEEQKEVYRGIFQQAASENIFVQDVIEGRTTFLRELNSVLRGLFLTKGMFDKERRGQLYRRLWNLEMLLDGENFVINANDDSDEGWSRLILTSQSKDGKLGILTGDFTYSGRLKVNAFYLGSAVATGIVPGILLSACTDNWFLVGSSGFYSLVLLMDAALAKSKTYRLRHHARFLDTLIDKAYGKREPAKTTVPVNVDEGLMYEADRLFSSQEFISAISYYKGSLSRNPRNIKALARLAFSYLQVSEISQAEIYARQALRLDQFDVYVRLTLYLSLTGQKRVEDIFKDYDKLPKVLKENKEIKYQHALTYLAYRDHLINMGKYADAEELETRREEFLPMDSLLRLEKELKDK